MTFCILSSLLQLVQCLYSFWYKYDLATDINIIVVLPPDDSNFRLISGNSIRLGAKPSDDIVLTDSIGLIVTAMLSETLVTYDCDFNDISNSVSI